jgi:hypothetical protein
MSNMLDILKKFNAVEQKTKITECGSMPSSAPSTPVSVNLSAPTAQDMAQMLRALANIESGEKPAMAAMPMAMAADAMEAEYETDEAFVNEPDEEYADHKFMTKDLSGGINRQKTMYKPAAKGDNPMAVESIKDRLYHALNEKKAKPDFLDMDKDGNKKEPMKKAVADKEKKAPVKEGAAPYAPVYIQYLKQQFGDKKELSRNEKAKVAEIIKKSSIKHLEQLAAADIPHVSRAAKYYLRTKTPGGMVRPLESVDEAAKPDFLDMDKDGNKKEPMKKAVADKKKHPFKK